jgi:hypothetical protein
MLVIEVKRASWCGSWSWLHFGTPKRTRQRPNRRRERERKTESAADPRLGRCDSVNGSFRSHPHRNELLWRKSLSPKSFRSKPRTENIHEEGLARGARPGCGIDTDHMVNTERRELELPAFVVFPRNWQPCLVPRVSGWPRASAASRSRGPA